MSGLFITLEGIEGSGKSTQAKRLAAHLEARGRSVLLTREPGGTVISEAIRAILLNPEFAEMKPITELLLYQAARAQHVEQVIQPALAEDTIVICDRFIDSTLAYQGAGRKLSQEVLRVALDPKLFLRCKPDLTLLLDLDVETGLERSRNEEEWDRIEQESVEFHTRVRQGFLDIAERDTGRIRMIDARRTPDEIEADIATVVDDVLDGNSAP